jgi:predicted nucleic-acid-binding Zn-ribbon protein
MATMPKCPKCDNTDIRVESGRLEGATMGASRLFFAVHICKKCGYTELYFQEKSYLYIGHRTTHTREESQANTPRRHNIA